MIDAEASLKRNQELLAKKFIPQAVVDTSKAKVEALRGTKRANQAGMQSSKVALGYNRIAASIGAIDVHSGSLVQLSGAAMVTIAQLDPVHVSFTVPEAELAHIVASYPNGNAPVIYLALDKYSGSGPLKIDSETTVLAGGFPEHFETEIRVELFTGVCAKISSYHH